MIMDKAGQLFYSASDGEGELRISTEFDNLNALLRADILKDWIHELESYYNEAVMEAFPESTSHE